MGQNRLVARPRTTLTRRRLLWGAAVVTGAAGGLRGGRSIASAASLEGVELPPDVGQSAIQVYVPETGHTIRGTMLDYWRANGAASVFGNPISEPFAAPNGYYSQAFEQGILQYRPEFLWSEEPIMRLMPVFDGQFPRGRSGFGRTDRRMNGGGHPRGLAWAPLPADSRKVSRAIEAGGLYFEETGHTLTGTMLEWYREHEGQFYLGHPMSEAYDEEGVRTQYFEGGCLKKTAAGVRLARLDGSIFRELELDLDEVDRRDLPSFDELLFWEAPNPNPLGDPYAPGRKRIEISLGEQRLWAYQGNVLITTTLVSTGLSPNDTDLGLFRVRLKYPEQDMQGFTDESGEVLGTGADAPAGTIPYAVEDVPHVMYFNLQAEALHGAYWHNNFGTPMSHGCVNLPLDVAAFLYGWAPLGTPVWVHE